jgi:hypothetical protein
MFFPTDTNITLFITDGINSMNYLKKYYAVVYNKLSKVKNIRWNKYMYTDIACFLKDVKYCNYARKSIKIFYLCVLHSHIWDSFLILFLSFLSHIVVVSFIGGGNLRTRRKPKTCRKSLTNFIT